MNKKKLCNQIDCKRLAHKGKYWCEECEVEAYGSKKSGYGWEDDVRVSALRKRARKNYRDEDENPEKIEDMTETEVLTLFD